MSNNAMIVAIVVIVAIVGIVKVTTYLKDNLRLNTKHNINGVVERKTTVDVSVSNALQLVLYTHY
jgi:hypothetical protein